MPCFSETHLNVISSYSYSSKLPWFKMFPHHNDIRVCFPLFFNRTHFSGGNALNLYSGGSRFESRPATGYPDWGFPWFSSTPQIKCRDCTSIIPQPLPSKSFKMNNSFFILPSDAIYPWYWSHHYISHNPSFFHPIYIIYIYAAYIAVERRLVDLY
jgi:hypothetical protein